MSQPFLPRAITPDVRITPEQIAYATRYWRDPAFRAAEDDRSKAEHAERFNNWSTSFDAGRPDKGDDA